MNLELVHRANVINLLTLLNFVSTSSVRFSFCDPELISVSSPLVPVDIDS